MGLTIDPAHRDGVLVFLDYGARTGHLLMSFPLDDECEPASVFEP